MRYLILLSAVSLTGCATYTSPDGRTQTALTPLAASVLEAGLSSGLGMATGALMNSSPGWANGGVSAAVGSVGSQVVSALTQTARSSQAAAGYAGYPHGGMGQYYGPNSPQYPAQYPQPAYYRARGGWNPPPQYPQDPYLYSY